MTGCVPPEAVQPIPEAISHKMALELYNANVRAVPSYSAKIAGWHVKFMEDGRPTSHQGQGAKLFYRPADHPARKPRFYLQADTTLMSRVFVMASNEKEYWMYSRPAAKGWWGSYENAERCRLANPLINPQFVLEFMGMRPIPDDPAREPLSIFKVTPKWNIISFAAMTDRGLLLRREIKIDRRSNLPVEITAYDRTGQAILIAQLTNYQKIGQAMLPGEFILRHPPDGSFIKFVLRDFRIDEKNRDALFVRNPTMSGIEEFIQIDTLCDEN
ncbi:MAG: hypothetical protein IID32_02970 [Planctomycetes bacterium]|nr:hypothetical protein [Planctomycetota bacterium]